MEPHPDVEPVHESARRSWFLWLRMKVVGGIRLFFGTLMCQLVPGAVLVAGWSVRMMENVTRQRWQRHIDPEPPAAPILPNWFMAQDARQRWEQMWQEKRTRLLYPPWLFRQLFGSFWLNLKRGVLVLLNTWILTLPGMSLWVFSWFAGWNNSFYKGYEYAYVGPVTGVLGILLFMLAMLFVPMAIARQASTGEWKRFYDFRVINLLIAEKPLSYFALGAAYSLFSLVVSILIAMRMFLPNILGDSMPQTAVEQLEFISNFSYWIGVPGLVFYLVLRWWAARIYAMSVVRSLERGRLNTEDLGEQERMMLKPWLETLQPQPSTGWVRSGRYILGWGGALAVLLFVWFTFSAQIYVRQFFIYDSVRGWVNQPMVHMPWFDYVPQALREAAQRERESISD